MTPRTPSAAIAIVFVGCVIAVVVLRAAGAVERGNLRITGVLVGLVWTGLAISLSRGVIRGSSIERWLTLLASASIAAGVYVNSAGQPKVELVVIGITSGLCAVGLLTPFVGRHFSKKSTLGLPAAEQPTPAGKSE